MKNIWSYFTERFQPIPRSTVIPRATRALDAMAWANLLYDQSCHMDCDDYAQTVLLMLSIAEKGGLDAEHFITNLRSHGVVKWGEDYLPPSGIPLGHATGQISKLLKSTDHDYRASDGITDGAAMRTLGLALRYGKDLHRLAKETDACARITHSEIEARAAAVFVAARYAQVFYGRGNMARLIKNVKPLYRELGYGERGQFFLKLARKAAGCIGGGSGRTLVRLMQEIGMLHLAFSTPITAVAYSYVGSARDKPLLEGITDVYTLTIDGKPYDGGCLSDVSHESFVAHLEKYDQLDQHDRDYFQHDEQIRIKPRRIDADTFFSIAFSLIAAKQERFLSMEDEALVNRTCSPHRKLVEESLG